MTQNLLHLETSPYLLQHKDNPVHWQPWGESAFALARDTGKPILLSIGYAACHWCHVMAHESFESPEIADLMNANFINIKVDREERPDVDRIYMSALHALGEQGGWPLTMFLDSTGAPFWGGTYFPPEARYGRPGFPQILRQISQIWTSERHKIASNVEALKQALQYKPQSAGTTEVTPENLHLAAQTVLAGFDAVHGGLKGAPKFPNAPILNFLAEHALRTGDKRATEALHLTLTKICQGGIYDHLGGGFARYTVDARWLVPHFEKMLYDNAQLISLLTNLAATTGNELFRIRIEETIDFVLNHMTAEAKAFASSYDADSEGEEGKYYVWSSSEIKDVLGPDAPLFAKTYDVTRDGNWEGHNILNRLHTQALLDPETEAHLTSQRAKLRHVRTSRIPPGFDDKILADWNGLMIEAFAHASLLYGRQDWLARAETSFDHVIGLLHDGAILHHAYRNGERRGITTADGYANLISAALALYAASANLKHLANAERLTAEMISSYWDHEEGGFYFTSSHTTDLIVRSKFPNDDATPNANGIMLRSLARLHAITGNPDYLVHAEAILRAFGSVSLGNPFACPGILAGALNVIDRVDAVLVAPPDSQEATTLLAELLNLCGTLPLIQRVTAADDLPQSHPAFSKTRASVPTLYLCRGQVCASPSTTPQQVRDAAKLLRLA